MNKESGYKRTAYSSTQPNYGIFCNSKKKKWGYIFLMNGNMDGAGIYLSFCRDGGITAWSSFSISIDNRVGVIFNPICTWCLCVCVRIGLLSLFLSPLFNSYLLLNTPRSFDKQVPGKKKIQFSKKKMLFSKRDDQHYWNCRFGKNNTIF